MRGLKQDRRAKIVIAGGVDDLDHQRQVFGQGQDAAGMDA
jgi:hypothetical protein